MEYPESRRALVEERLETVLDRVEPTELAAEVRHVALSGGKRVRPTVTVLSCEAAGGKAEDAVDFAVGVELVHDASLVVDDIIDRSSVRRGNASAWAEFGHGPAIIASDGLLGEAFELFSPDPRAMEAVADAMVELGEGEATELVARPTDREEYMELARRKTGALFRAAAELGALAADADPATVEAFGEYAEKVGIAFQIRDDVLDATADADDLGKPTGHDAEMGRPSIVRVTDLDAEEADDLAHEYSEAALAALDRAETPDSTATGYLRDLAAFVVTREH
ncbi:polyprenyl synthetase family protein [Halorussus salilacus]|uniref:polyprenyl synthetase family protein n=1 Tax=Halorussus salilacus TaxID=2953750 RepID=UPI0020A00829|nr:polyprenyl synthetase family protein [Halorussus salilacus]USZ66929.1 polyprenyl synthetase family protein [Halorussus salilacus]